LKFEKDLVKIDKEKTQKSLIIMDGEIVLSIYFKNIHNILVKK